MLDTIAMAAQLEGEYKTIFEKADMYGTLEKCSDENIRDDKMMNLYDLLLQAQIDKTPVSKIIGEDIEEFCKSYFFVLLKTFIFYFPFSFNNISIALSAPI